MNAVQSQNPRADYSAHFLSRLDRLPNAELELAKFLYQHPDLVRLVLERVAIPSDCSRVVVSLSERVNGPRVVASRDGALVTILAEGMVCNPHATVAVGYDVLLNAMIAHDVEHCLAWVIHELAPYRDQISRIHDQQEVAVFFLDVAPAVEAAARSIGWRGGARELAPLNRTRAEHVASMLAAREKEDELVVARTSTWLRGRRRGRVFVAVEAGVVCLNYRPPANYSVEEGTIAPNGLVCQPTAARLAARYFGRARMGRGS